MKLQDSGNKTSAKNPSSWPVKWFKVMARVTTARQDANFYYKVHANTRYMYTYKALYRLDYSFSHFMSTESAT